MTSKEFANLTAGLNAYSIVACRLVLVEGWSINAAAREYGMSHSTVIRMLRKIPRHVCPTCKQPRKDLLNSDE